MGIEMQGTDFDEKKYKGFTKVCTDLVIKDYDTNMRNKAVQLNADIPVMALPSTNA